LGWLTNPRKAAYNRVYNRTTVGCAVMAGAHAEAAASQLFEAAVTFRSLGRKTDEPVHFYVELLKDGQSVERIPQEGAIETKVPSPDYELMMWQA